MKEFEINNKKLEISQNSEQKKAVQGEHEALSRLSEAEFQTGEFLEERRNQILSEGKSEMLMHESRAERSAHAIRELGRQLRSQHVEIYHRAQENEESRGEKTWLRAGEKAQ